MNKKAEVTKIGVFDMQVCVPENFTDKQVIDFASSDNPCGTRAGWQIRRKENKGYKERVECEERSGFVHIMLDA